MASTTESTQVKDNDKNVLWYMADLKHLSLPARQLLETYSQIPADQVIPHILAIRNRAWNIWPYPCIGQFRFLDLSISFLSSYSIILQRLQDNHILLDLGCCFGQDIRRLVADGAPAHNLIGTDLQQGFIDLGYDLFRDRETLMSKFFVSDILGNDASLTDLNGNLDIIHASSFFHLFPLSKQTEIAKRLVKLLRPVPGSLILGRQTGNVTPGEYKHGSHDQTGMWRHDAASWEEMWRVVGLNTGSAWRVEANLESTKGFTKRDGENEMAWRNEGDRGLRFEVWRL